MRKTSKILSSKTIGITELKRNPMAVVKQCDPVAVLSRNKPVFYAIPAETYEAMLERLEDLELAAIVRARQDQPRSELDWSNLST
ncbi:type II toxin-antitoxin system prevent-host-death family antitoxin [uncultured Methylophaga sp.]|uniref:type II toxin-antitoxin system Phd/YefM family antitoxin n=1 Tax=uncultured Methylophaga sp. TaxID=285271 RepID=UPI002625F191|nr:type II toxin-antitoxin system prevent-host-death family antitoxin [uncultured Methylophaga sp.]